MSILGKNRKVYIKTGMWAGCVANYRSQRKEDGKIITTVRINTGYGKEPMDIELKKEDFTVYYNDR